MTKKTAAEHVAGELRLLVREHGTRLMLERLRALESVARAAKRDGHPDCPCDTCRALSRLSTPKRARKR